MKNREIKFRAWHKEEKVLCKVATLTDDGAFLVGVKKGKDQIQDRMIAYAPDDGRFCRNEEIELMQFTGLKDALGKEIWEGDLCEISGWNIKFIVIYDTNSSRFTVQKSDKTSLFDYIPIATTKVIGNIYESEGLLAVAPLTACR
jgi:uncharacterized phage protein (TIGR01671 family)